MKVGNNYTISAIMETGIVESSFKIKREKNEEKKIELTKKKI